MLGSFVLHEACKQAVVAEGVEAENQLVATRCDQIQGYLLSKPLDERAAETLLLQHSLRDPVLTLHGAQASLT